MTIDLAGETALVTGGSRGIGRAVALALAGVGAKVAVHYRQAEREAREVTPLAFRADLEKEADVRALHAAVEREAGPVSILVNNAGIWEDNPTGTVEAYGRYRRLMRINLDAAYLLCDLVVPGMKRLKRGSILNISSRAGQRGEPRAAHYAMSKGAMNAMTVALARELAEWNIRVNAIAPGWIETPMTALHLADPETRREVLGQTLLGRVGTPDDIAGAALFLVSPLASYVTAQIVHVNGGSYLNT